MSEWRSIFRQLVSRDLLTVDIQGYGGLRLTTHSRPVLRGEKPLQLRKDSKPARVQKESRPAIKLTSPADLQLWEALRSRRKQLAEQQGVPPYIIFHDMTLKEMAEYRPVNKVQLSRINGVGEHKLERYGEIFLQVIREHTISNDDTNKNTLLTDNLGMRTK